MVLLTDQDSGIAALSRFIDEVTEHLLDRASQRENVINKSRQIYKNSKEDGTPLHEALPEYLNGAVLIPDETFVLVGYSTTDERFRWYEDNKRYIFRMYEETGSLELSSEVVNAKYILLRRSGQPYASDLYQIKSRGPKVFSRAHLDQLGYPLSARPKEHYLAVEIGKVTDDAFTGVRWDFKKLGAYKKIQQEFKNPYTKAGMPFTVSLTELMKTKVKTQQ